MKCPKCASPDVTRAAVVWENGVQVGQSQTLGVGLVGAGGIGIGGALTNTESKSLAAARLAPPVPEKVGGAFLISLFATFGWMILIGIVGSQVDPQASPLWSLALFGGPIVIFWWFYAQRGKKVRKVAAEHAARTDAWSKLWYCTRCGNTGDEGEFGVQTAP